MLSALSLAALSLAPLQDTVAAQPPRSLLEAVPADAVLAVVVEDFPALCARLQSSAWAEVLRAPQAAAFWGQVRETLLEDVPDEIEQADLLGALQSVVIYGEGIEELGQFPWGLAATLRPDRDRARALILEALDRNGEGVEHEARQITLRQAGESWLAGHAWQGGFAFSRAPERDMALERVAALAGRLEEGSREASLATRLGPRRQSAVGAVELYLDAGTLSEAFRSASQEPTERAAWEAMGFAGLGWISVQASLGDRVTSDVLTRMDLPPKGLWARWASCARPAPIELARLAPANAIEVAVLGFDLASAWRALRETLAESMPDQAAQLDAGLEAARSTAGIDIEGDLIGMLTGDFAEILLPVEKAAPAPAPGLDLVFTSALFGLSGFPGAAPGSAGVIGLRETAPIEEILETLIELAEAGEQVEDEEIGGRWMTSIVSPGIPMQPTWAFLDGALIYSLHAEPVRALLAQAVEGAPPYWLETGSRREALASEAGACMASIADLQGWVQAEIVSPLDSWAELAGEFDQDEDATTAGLLDFAEILPGLVEKHIVGTMRSALWIEGSELRYRVWIR